VAPGIPAPDPWREQPAVEEPVDPEDLLWGVEGEADVDMGMMWHSTGQFDEFAFEDLGPVAVGFFGGGGRVEGGSRAHGLGRFVLALESDVRIAHVPATGSEPAGTFDEGGTEALFRVVPTLGYDSRTFEVAGGAYFGNGMPDTPVYLAAHARFGRYDKFHFRMAILDERGCFPAQCLAALSFGFGVNENVRGKVGFSFGDGVVRVWTEVDFRAFGRWWDVLGDFALHDDAATLSLAIGTAWVRE
jgi:hypothetical protein